MRDSLSYMSESEAVRGRRPRWVTTTLIVVLGVALVVALLIVQWINYGYSPELARAHGWCDVSDTPAIDSALGDTMGAVEAEMTVWPVGTVCVWTLADGTTARVTLWSD
jgi:hypothetical protein